MLRQIWRNSKPSPQYLMESIMARCSSGGLRQVEHAKLYHSGALAPVHESVAYGLSLVHTLTGLPWWATIAASTVALKLATTPLKLAQETAYRSLIPAFVSNWRRFTYQSNGNKGVSFAQFVNAARDRWSKEERKNHSPSRTASDTTEKCRPHSCIGVYTDLRGNIQARKTHRALSLRKRGERERKGKKRHRGFRHRQIAIFATAFTTLRWMAYSGYNGFEIGGVFWYES